MRTALIVLAALVVLLLGLRIGGGLRQKGRVRGAFAALRARARPSTRVVRHADLEALPPPVRRWLTRAVPDGTPVPREVTLRQEGTFRVKPDADWLPLRASQVFSLEPPGYVWEATVPLMPGLPFHGLDSIVGERAVFSGRLFGLFQVVGAEDETIMRAGMLRFLGESVWFPQVLAASEHVRWEAVGERRARVYLTHAGREVHGEFEFDAEDRPVRFFALRPRDVAGEIVDSPWGGRYEAFERVDGVEVPTRAEVAWFLPEGDYTYWAADLSEFRFAE